MIAASRSQRRDDGVIPQNKPLRVLPKKQGFIEPNLILRSQMKSWPAKTQIKLTAIGSEWGTYHPNNTTEGSKHMQNLEAGDGDINQHIGHIKQQLVYMNQSLCTTDYCCTGWLNPNWLIANSIVLVHRGWRHSMDMIKSGRCGSTIIHMSSIFYG